MQKIKTTSHFWAFYNIFTGMPKACQIFRHKSLTPNCKVHWSPSLCKKLKQSDYYFWRKWSRTSFSAFYNIFLGMHKACQMFPAQPTDAKSLSLLASIMCKKLERSYDQFLRKWSKTSFLGILQHFHGMPKACQIFGINCIRQIINSIGAHHYAKN